MRTFISFMTARDDFASKQRGYRIGVDDYMVKPIDLDELFLRIGRQARRAKIASSRKLEIGSFTMDMTSAWPFSGMRGNFPYQPGIQHSLQAFSYPKKTFHPAAADGCTLGRGHGYGPSGGGCVHDQAAQQARPIAKTFLRSRPFTVWAIRRAIKVKSRNSSKSCGPSTIMWCFF